MFRIALASPPVSGSVDAAMPWVERFIAEAAEGGADIVCFPECCVPGLRGQDFAVEAHDPVRLAEARERVRVLAATHRIAVIIPMDWDSPEGILNVAFVISAEGEVLGCQTKNQIAPEEDVHYVPGREREMFEVKGVPFAMISPEGACLDHLPYGRPGLLLADIDPETASRLYARRFAPETYR